MLKANVHVIPNGVIAPITQEECARSTSVHEICKHLNFKVPHEFHREFKTFAASHDISMTALLIEAFDALREQNSR